ncbi:MAG: galactose-1-phosphate uridylyltransferase [Candidatus Omnitrophica bacterium]|nr:galactose-1-phosphate uridylyltransferase [Candidatus Omnitrophota bacterium]
MSELRRDPIIGRWVFVETDESSWHPQDYEVAKRHINQAAVCQLCPGKEAQTPPEVAAVRNNGSPENSPNWLVRVVPNKFPALKIEGELEKRGEGIYDLSNGIGAHEVLIETPDHNLTNLADFKVEDIVNVIKLYQNRSLGLAKDKRFKYIMIFKNYGESAGASVEHAHSQIIALPMVPKYVLEALEGYTNYYSFRGRCVYCDMVEQEGQQKERIVAENESFISFCPYVPRYPFECWILPKEHASEFRLLSDDDTQYLARILKETLYRIKAALGDPSYNFYIHVAPVNCGGPKNYHWHIEILPQLTRVAGFEWGTGFYIIKTSPAVAASHLRKVDFNF